MASEPPRRLPPKVRELVEADRNSRPSVGRLTSDEIELLTAVARHEGEFDVPVSAHRAISALATGAPPDVAVPPLASVLSNGAAPVTDRVAAALGLGHVATPEAERALLRHAADRDPRVQQDVLAALGRFAGPAAAGELGRLPAPADPAVHRQLLFTRALIAHRHGLDGPFLPPARTVERAAAPPEQATTVELNLKTAQAAADDLARLRGPTYGIRLTDRALSLRCGRAEWTIFINPEVGPSATSLTRLLDRPWIAAVLAQWYPRKEAMTTRLVLLTRPADNRIHIDLVRADGEVVYTGTAVRAGAVIAFEISDVDRPGTAPTKVAGRLSDTGIDLEVAVASATRVGTRSAVTVLPPAGS